MPRIPLMDAQADMVLSDDLFNDQQMLLLKKGTVLNTKNIKMLKSWGIALISVASETETLFEPVGLDRTACLSSIEERMANKFNGMDDNEVMNAIRRVATDIIMRRCHHQDTADAD